MVALFGLPALIGVVAVLGLVAAPTRLLPARGVAPATAGLCLLAMMFALGILAAGGQGQRLDGGVAIDPLAAFFVLLLAFAGVAAACASLGRSVSGLLPGVIGAALLVVLAGDARVALLGVAVLALGCSGWRLRPAAVAGVFLLAGAFAVLSIPAGPNFALMRAMPPEGWQATIVLVLTLLGLAPLVGWAPWHRPFLAAEASGVPIAVLGPVIGLYLATRVLADLCGPATPGWWGLPILLVGAACAGFGVAAALRSPRFDGVLAGFGVQHGGWMLAGLGVAVVARGADVLPLASLALGGAMLHALNHTVLAMLAMLAMEAAAVGAGSQTLERLGGLAARMPVVAAGMLVGGLSLASLPPSAGFASGWMLLQALFAAPRIGGLSLQLAVAAAIGLFGLSAGFGVVAAIRVGGVAFLGRPRTPRAAAAEDVGLAQRSTILGLVALGGLLGMFPGVALQLTSAAQRVATAAGLDGQGGLAGLRTQLDLPGYLPLAVMLLLAAGLAAVAIAFRTGTLPSAQAVPAWEDGFAAPPAWMPFGDPATQVTPAVLAATLPARPLHLPALPRVRFRVEVDGLSIGPRHGAMAVLALAVLLLLAVAVFGPA